MKQNKNYEIAHWLQILLTLRRAIFFVNAQHRKSNKYEGINHIAFGMRKP